MALGNLGAGLGSMFFSSIIAVSVEYYGFAGCMLLMGAVSFHLCIAGSFMRPFTTKPPTPFSSRAESIVPETTTHLSMAIKEEEEGQASHYSALISMFSGVAVFLPPEEEGSDTAMGANQVQQELLHRVSLTEIHPNDQLISLRPTELDSIQTLSSKRKTHPPSFRSSRSLEFSRVETRGSKRRKLPIGTLASLDENSVDSVSQEIDSQALRSHSSQVTVDVSTVQNFSVFHEESSSLGGVSAEARPPHVQSDVRTRYDVPVILESPERSSSARTMGSIITRKSIAVKNSFLRALAMCRHPTLASYCFILLAMSLCYTYTVVFLPDSAVTRGSTESEAATLLAVYGIFDAAGMLAWGFIYDLPRFRNNLGRLLFAMSGKKLSGLVKYF